MQLEKLPTTLWYSISSEQALKILQSNISGLSFQEAEERLKIFGLNVLPRSKKQGFLITYLNQFKNPLIYLLLVAVVISLLIQHLSDALFILIVLQINALIGGVQEWKAEAQAESAHPGLCFLSFCPCLQRNGRHAAGHLLPV